MNRREARVFSLRRSIPADLIAGALLLSLEVGTVVSQLGRPDDGTEVTGFFKLELGVDLKPQAEWPAGIRKPDLVREIDARLTREFPGVDFSYSQNIEDNVNEALSGVKGENSVKVFGPDLQSDEQVANQVSAVLSRVPGIVDAAVYRSLGQPNVLITPDRGAAARYGVNVGDVASVIQAAIGGQAATQVLEGNRRFDLVVHWPVLTYLCHRGLRRKEAARAAVSSDGTQGEIS